MYIDIMSVYLLVTDDDALGAWQQPSSIHATTVIFQKHRKLSRDRNYVARYLRVREQPCVCGRIEIERKVRKRHEGAVHGVTNGKVIAPAWRSAAGLGW